MGLLPVHKLPPLTFQPGRGFLAATWTIPDPNRIGQIIAFDFFDLANTL